MTIIKFDFNEMVTLNGNQVMTTSLKVVEYFGKRHDNVIRSIKNIECSREFRELNFEEANYLDEQGKFRPMFRMTKDGFIFLVMGFTGKAAAMVKENYINAFNWMAAKLQSSQSLLLKEMNDWSLMNKHSKFKGSIGSGLMHERKREKKIIESEYQRLIEDSQINLLI